MWAFINVLLVATVTHGIHFSAILALGVAREEPKNMFIPWQEYKLFHYYCHFGGY